MPHRRETSNNHNTAKRMTDTFAFGEHYTQSCFSLLPILPLRLIVVRWRVEAGADDDVADGRLRLLTVQFVGTR